MKIKSKSKGMGSKMGQRGRISRKRGGRRMKKERGPAGLPKIF